jgi:hypothetical protein
VTVNSPSWHQKAIRLKTGIKFLRELSGPSFLPLGRGATLFFKALQPFLSIIFFLLTGRKSPLWEKYLAKTNLVYKKLLHISPTRFSLVAH